MAAKVTLNVYVKDQNGNPIPNARVTALTRNQVIDPPVRQVSGDGGCNLYFQGPIISPPVAISLLVDAPGYVPWSTSATPIQFGDADVNYQVVLQSFKQPFQAAPRVWKGQMCGIHVPGLQPVPGGAADPTLVLSWFYDRYSQADRIRIWSAWADQGYTHVALSWPDSRAQGATPESFLATCEELISAGFFPCVFLTSKDYDSGLSVTQIMSEVSPVLQLLVGTVPMFCVGWELSLWLEPVQVQALIDIMTAIWLQQPGTLGYVHFQPGYFAFQLDGLDTAAFWVANVGKLHGLLHQRNPLDDNGDMGLYQARITDCLQRFAGQFFCPPDSGFGRPFDFVAYEITANEQFNGTMDTQTGDRWGQAAVATAGVQGPTVVVGVMGSGNGQ